MKEKIMSEQTAEQVVSEVNTTGSNTDTSNKNTSFFAALETASKEDTKETQSSSTGYMSVADYIKEDEDALEVVQGDDEPHDMFPHTINDKMHEDCNCERITRFLSYLQNKGLITVNKKFKVCDELKSYHDDKDTLQPVQDLQIVQANPEGIEDGIACPTTFTDDIEEYVDKTLDALEEVSGKTIDKIIAYYEDDSTSFLNSEWNNLNTACTIAQVPENLVYAVQDKIMELFFPINEEFIDEEPDDTDMYYEDLEVIEGDN